MEQILNTLVEQYQDEMIEALKELVRIPSVKNIEEASEGAPFGPESRQALSCAIELAERLGFETKDYDGYAAAFSWGSEGKEVGVLSHLDVVPAGDGWNTDPYDPVIIDGKMFGRGTIDDKGPFVAALYAAKAIMESGLPVSNHVKHIVGCNEEAGHDCVEYYLTKEKGPDLGFSPDAEFPVIHAEKAMLKYRVHKTWDNMDTSGLSVEKIKAGTVINAVPNLAKVWISDAEGNVEMKEYHGIAAHGSLPEQGENAIAKMVANLCTMDFADENVKDYFQAINELFCDGWEGRNLGIACEDQLSGKLTVNLGLMSMDEKQATVSLDIRIPIHADMKIVEKTILLACERKGLEVEVLEGTEAVYVPKESGLVQKLLGVYNEMTGSSEEAVTIGGGTYCREVKNIVSFGPLFPGEPDTIHQANERIDLENFILMAKIYAQALYELMK